MMRWRAAFFGICNTLTRKGKQRALRNPACCAHLRYDLCIPAPPPTVLQLPQHNCSTSHTYAPPPTEVNDGTISTTNFTNFTNSKPAEQNRLKWAAVPVAAGQCTDSTRSKQKYMRLFTRSHQLWQLSRRPQPGKRRMH